MRAIDKLKVAIERDPEIACTKKDIHKTLGSDPRWLKDLGLNKSDLLKLEKLGFAYKARYEIEKESKRWFGDHKVTGPHRLRWILIRPGVHE